ncbi:MAG: hypothetical protein AAF384_19140 [Pseudomonadota bacterium]
MAADGSLAEPAATLAWVDLTIALTFVIGVIFLSVGRWAKQRWLVFWGALSCLASATYGVLRFSGVI